MNLYLERLKAFKEHMEPVVWLIVSVVAPAGAGLLLAWSLFISPKVDQYFKSLTSELSAELQKHTSLLEIIKHKISDEVDSTYYVTKRYVISANPEKKQEPLTQFFYVGPEDKVSIFIWYSGRERMKMLISINDGPTKSLENFPRFHSWTNVDITDFVKSSATLNEDMYEGISGDVYNISITPIPNQLPQKQGHKISFPRETVTEVDVYALVIVRRGPLK